MLFYPLDIPKLLCFFCLVFPVLLGAQDLRFQHYNSQDGMSDDIGFGSKMLQDQKGFLWIPSLNGLNRFDGQSFLLFQYGPDRPNGLASNKVADICQGQAGEIWLGFGGSGIQIYYPEKGIYESILHDPANPKGLCGNDIRAIHKDDLGNIWIQAVGAPVCRCEAGTREFKAYPDIEAHTLLHQDDGQLWLGGNRGLYKYLPTQDSFIRFTPFPEKKDFLYNSVFEMIEGPNGEIWFTSRRKGQGIFNPTTSSFREFPTELILEPGVAVKDIFKDRKGNIWFGGSAKVARLNPSTHQFDVFQHDPEEANSCQQGAIVSIFEDRAGSMWFSSYVKEGLSVVHSPQNPFQELPQDYSNLITWNDRYMLLSGAAGFALYDINTRVVSRDSLPPVLLRAKGNLMKLSPNQNLWWWDRGQRKVLGYNLKTKAEISLDQNEKFELDTRGNVWFRRPFYYDILKDSIIHYEQDILAADTSGLIAKGGYQTVAVDAQDRVWLGTRLAGLVCYDPHQKKARIFQHHPETPFSLAKGTVNMILPGSNGWVYISTSEGFSIYQPEKNRFVNLYKPQGMPNSVHPPMIEDSQGNIWIGAQEGLLRLNVEDFSLQCFEEVDGLPKGWFYFSVSAKDARNHLYFMKGYRLFRFDPSQVTPKNHVSPVVLTDFYLNLEREAIGGQHAILQKSIEYQEKIRLPHPHTDFGFRFISPNFYKSDKINYFYQLENYNEAWVNNGNSVEVHFTNIPPGTYRFKVKARTQAGYWTAAATGVDIRVLPPWWRTRFAYCCYLLLFLAVIWWVRHYELKRLASINEAKRFAELDSLKTELYTNITHEFRTPLTVIQGMAGQIAGDDEARKLILRNSKNLLHLVNQLLDMSKLESGKMKLRLTQHNIIPYLLYLTNSFQSYAEVKNIHLDFQHTEQEIVMDYDPEKVQYIMTNLLSNAIKFTPKGGQVQVAVSLPPIEKFSQSSALLKIEVRDNGRGIKPEHLPHIFDRFYQVDSSATRQDIGTGIGLALTKELVEVMGGTIAVESEFTQGSAFTLLLPIHRDVNTIQATPVVSEEAPFFFETSTADQAPASVESPDKELPLLLIVEDNRDVIAYIKRCLDRKYQIAVAYDGQKGIDKALELIPDIIISDVMMPKVDGFTLTRTLKHDIRTSHVPIIMLTAKADLNSRIEGLERGADAYLAKPFHKKELLIRLEKLIELRQKIQARYVSLGQLPPTVDKGLQIEDAFLQKVKEEVELHLDNADFTVAQLCRSLGMSQSQLYRKVKALTNKSIASYIRAIRLQKGLELLKTTDLNVSEVAYEIGFSDPFYFSRTFSQEFGFPPSKVGKG